MGCDGVASRKRPAAEICTAFEGGAGIGGGDVCAASGMTVPREDTSDRAEAGGSRSGDGATRTEERIGYGDDDRDEEDVEDNESSGNNSD